MVVASGEDARARLPLSSERKRIDDYKRTVKTSRDAKPPEEDVALSDDFLKRSRRLKGARPDRLVLRHLKSL